MLAAGQGRRYGSGGNKLLANWRGRPILGHVLDTLTSARARRLIEGGVVVTPAIAPELAELARAAELMPVAVAGDERSMAVSLAAGIAALDRGPAGPAPDAALIVLGDQPSLSLHAIDAVIAAAADPPTALARARYSAEPEVPGHPVLLGRRWWPVLADLRGDRGLDRLIRDRGLVWQEVRIEGANPDVDSPDDLRRLADS